MTQYDSSTLAVHFRCWSVVALCMLISMGIVVSQGTSQITVKSLLEPAIRDAAPKQYPDVRDAIVRFHNSDINGARELLNSASEKDPQLAPGELMLAQLFLLTNQLNSSNSTLEQVVKTHPDDPEAYLILGDTAFREKQFTASGMLFEKAQTLTDNYDGNPRRNRNMRIRAMAGMAAVAEVYEDWETAQSVLSAWIETDPDSPSAHTRLGQTLFYLADYKVAYAEFQKAYELDGELPRPEISMAQLYSKSGKQENARKLVGLAVQRASDDLNTRIRAAQWYLENGFLDEAQENADAALQSDENSLRAQVMTGLVGRYRKDYEGAEKAFQAAHLLDPANFVAMNHLSLTLIELPDEGKRRRATAYAQTNSLRHGDVQQPLGREATITFAWVLYRIERRTEAMRLVSTALRAGGVSQESAYLAARILYDQGRPDTARQLLEPVLQRKTVFPNHEDAEKLLQKIIGGGS